MNEKTLNRLLAVMVMVCCGNAVAQTTTNHTLIIKPNEHVSWSCELWPAQSAEVRFVPGSAPKGYVYEGMSIETPPNPGFCWTGAGDRYCILNSLAKSAVAMVKATCTWKPKGGEGGGSGDAPLPVIIGTGTAIAIAQPGTYWNTADGVNVLALGMGTVVRALKDQGAPADSEWTCTTDQLMILPFGDLTRVTATGIVTSASAWDANVHSESLDYKGLSDDEPFTVVSVASVSAKPAVVCVGNSNIAYTITTAPTGFEYMVRYTPADTSTPGVKEVVATCGLSAATCTVTVISFELNLFAIERGRTMRFPSLLKDGNVYLNAQTGDGLFSGAYFIGKTTLFPDAISINWELQFRQYFTRKMTATFFDDIVVTNIESSWDGDIVYASEGYIISGMQELKANQ